MTDQIPVLEVVVDPRDYEGDLRDVVSRLRTDWKPEDIKFKFLTQGYVNHMVGCYVTDDRKEWLVARIFGTDLGITFTRDTELNCAKLFAEIEIGPPLYGAFANGYVSGFVEGTTYFWDDISAFQNIDLAKLVARALGKVHCKNTLELGISKYGVHKGKTVRDFIGDMADLPVPDVIIDEETTAWFDENFPSIEEIATEAKMILDRFDAIKEPSVLCHMDVNPTNIIYNESKGKVTLVDYEGTGINKPFWDICSFLIASSAGLALDYENLRHSSDFQKEFIRTYLRERNRLDEGVEYVGENDVERYHKLTRMVEIGTCFLMLPMGLRLALTPARHGEERGGKMFLKLGVSRFQYYKKYKDEFLASELE